VTRPVRVPVRALAALAALLLVGAAAACGGSSTGTRTLESSPASVDPPVGLPPLAPAIDGLPLSVVTFAVGGGAAGADGAQLVVRVALQPQDRAQGLKGVTTLPEGVGMLFVFAEPAPASGRGGFWMLDTLVPLDIAFVADGVVVGTATMQPCTAQPCPVTHPGVPYDAAVETVAGWLAARGVTVGTPVSWTAPQDAEE
jgi:uncharacterized membrane protein (UPF0127 family)